MRQHAICAAIVDGREERGIPRIRRTFARLGSLPTVRRPAFGPHFRRLLRPNPVSAVPGPASVRLSASGAGFWRPLTDRKRDPGRAGSEPMRQISAWHLALDGSAPAAPWPSLRPDARPASLRRVPRTSPAFSIVPPFPVLKFAAPHSGSRNGTGHMACYLRRTCGRILASGPRRSISGLTRPVRGSILGFGGFEAFGRLIALSMRGPRHVLILSAGQ